MARRRGADEGRPLEGPKSGEETFFDELRQRFEPRAKKDLEERWRDVAREEQLPPDGDWFIWLLQTGRGWGKTRAAGEWFYERGETRQRKMLLVGREPGDVRDYTLNGPGGLLTHHGDVLEHEPSNRRIIWPNGSVAHIRYGTKPDQFRGFGGDTIWLDEFCAWDYPEQSWRNIMLGAREGSPRICISTTPRQIRVFQEIREMERTVVVRGSTLENKANLADEFIENVVEPMVGTRLGRQEVGGELLEEVEGALWSTALIERSRINTPADGLKPTDLILWLGRAHDVELIRVVQGVDPSGGKADVGNVVVGKGPCGFCDTTDHHAFVLADETDNCDPQGAKWGEGVVDTYHRWNVDRILGESNFGGDMVENTVRTVEGGENVSYSDVHASRGKTRRAEPVASLYEQGKVHHVGSFPGLEEEMTTYVEGETDWSPNRMDGVVWAVTKLFDLESKKTKEKTPKTARMFGV